MAINPLTHTDTIVPSLLRDHTTACAFADARPADRPDDLVVIAEPVEVVR